MTTETFTTALYELRDTNVFKLKAVFKADNAPLERRLAALFWIVTVSDPDLTPAAFKLILTLPGQTPPIIEDPLSTPFGETMKKIFQSPELYRDKEPEGLEEALAIRFFVLAGDPSSATDDASDLILKLTTGKDGMWWLDWIRSQLPPSA